MDPLPIVHFTDDEKPSCNIQSATWEDIAVLRRRLMPYLMSIDCGLPVLFFSECCTTDFNTVNNHSKNNNKSYFKYLYHL